MSDERKKSPRAAKAVTGKRVAVRGVGWKKPITISQEKYDKVSKAILAVLSEVPIKFTELVQFVSKRLPNFDGSISWYTIGVARELESQGKIVRQVSPVRYFKPRRKRKTASSKRAVNTTAKVPSRTGKNQT